MTKQEINNKYAQVCGEIGHLTASIKQNELQILSLMQEVMKLNNEMAARTKAEQEIEAALKAASEAAEAKANASALTAESEAAQ